MIRKMLSEQYPGKLHLSRTQSNMEDDYFCLTLQDKKSGLEVVEVKIPMIQVANMIAGMTTEVEFVVNRNPEIGKKRERVSHKAYIPSIYLGSLSRSENWNLFQDIVQVDLDNRGARWKLCRGSYNAKRASEDDIGPYYNFTIERYE